MLDSIVEDDRRDPICRSNGENRNQHVLEHFVDAKATYDRRFSGRVEDAKQLLARKGLLNERDLSDHEINPISRKDAAVKIEAAARQYARKCGIDPEDM